MPLSTAQFQALFVGAAKPYAKYEQSMGSHQALYTLFTTLGRVRFQNLVGNLFPDQIKSLARGLTRAELTTVSGMTAATLGSLSAVNASWIKSTLRTVANINPPLGAQIAPNTLSQTASHLAHANTVVTEVILGRSPRNLIFDGSGNCVAEINFGNHGGTATSGHAHIYPVHSMPITGHHISGVPHFGNHDYPAGWRALPVGVVPARALWT